MNCDCMNWGYEPAMGEWANGHHPNCCMHPGRLATTQYVCQRCDNTFAVRGITASIQICPQCGGMSEPGNLDERDREVVDVENSVILTPGPPPLPAQAKWIGAKAVDEIKKEDQSRLAVLKIPYQEVTALLKPHVVVDGAEVIDVHHEFMSRTFCVVLRHSSFAVVPDGHELPVLNGAPTPKIAFDGATPPVSTIIKIGEPMPPGSKG